MKQFKAFLGAALLVFVVVFAVQNASTVEINFLGWSFSAPRALMVVFLLAIGFVLGWLASGLSALRQRHDDKP